MGHGKSVFKHCVEEAFRAKSEDFASGADLLGVEERGVPKRNRPLRQ
jgi:hypothetical protein